MLPTPVVSSLIFRPRVVLRGLSMIVFFFISFFCLPSPDPRVPPPLVFSFRPVMIIGFPGMELSHGAISCYNPTRCRVLPLLDDFERWFAADCGPVSKLIRECSPALGELCLSRFSNILVLLPQRLHLALHRQSFLTASCTVGDRING